MVTETLATVDPARSGGAESQLVVLVVEDEPTLRQLIPLALADLHDVTVRLARTIDNAVDLARDTRPALIVVDLIGSRRSGCETARRLKANPETRSIPVLGLSTMNPVGGFEHAFGVACDEYLEMPFGIDDLIMKVWRLARAGVAVNGNRHRG